MEKRTHQRVPMNNLAVDASDGVGFFHGTILDISRFGLAVSDFPKKLDEKTKKMTVVISGRGKNFKMSVRPRWSKVSGAKKSIGTEILNPPWGWTEFVMDVEPKQEDDPWETTLHL